MKILFIAPLPPPIHGQSLASSILLKELIKDHDVVIINMAKKRMKSFVNRICAIIKLLFIINIKSRGMDIIYLTISESIFGNFKDIFIYCILINQLNKIIIHLHGGAGMMEIMSEKHKLLMKINSYFINRIRFVIILGETFRIVFTKAIEEKKIKVVPNFAEDYLFIKEDELENKCLQINKIKILFLSNLIIEKGYMELFEAIIGFCTKIQSNIELTYAGGFKRKVEQENFFRKIQSISNINYEGIVFGDKKKRLFVESHIFCLPTYYPWEGQPISILEAYATGCVVITTDHSGIKDIFQDGINGYFVEKKSVKSIQNIIEKIVNTKENIKQIAKNNLKTASEKYRASIFYRSINDIVESN